MVRRIADDDTSQERETTRSTVTGVGGSGERVAEAVLSWANFPAVGAGRIRPIDEVARRISDGTPAGIDRVGPSGSIAARGNGSFTAVRGK